MIFSSIYKKLHMSYLKEKNKISTTTKHMDVK